MSGKAGMETIRKAAGRLIQSEAERLLEADPSVGSIEKARMAVRRRMPAVAKAEAGKVPVKKVVKSSLPTIADRVAAVVDKKAREVQASPGGHFGKSIYECRGEVWRTEQGKALRRLANEYGSDQESAVRKSGQHREALAVLAQWER